jgi:diamine N-acetyltransferase
MTHTPPQISFRAIEPHDVNLLFEWENNPGLWHLSNTLSPFSRYHLEQYILNSSNDIYADKQLRLIIEKRSENSASEVIGCIDLYDFDPQHRRAGIGILISESFRNQGFGLLSLKLLCEYAFNTLMLHQLYCSIAQNNPASMHIFQQAGFEIIGTKKEWLFIEGQLLDEIMLQKFNPKSLFYNK